MSMTQRLTKLPRGIHLDRDADDGRPVAVATDGHRVAVSRSTEGAQPIRDFPNWVRVIRDAQWAFKAEVARRPLLKALRELAKVGRADYQEAARAHRAAAKAHTTKQERERHKKLAPLPESFLAVRLTGGDGTLTLSLSDERRVLDAEGLGGINVCYNAQYLLDAVGWVGGDKVTVEFGDAYSPTRIVGTEGYEVIAAMRPVGG